MKKYCEDMIMYKFYNLTKDRKIDVLQNALGLMGICNSQSETDVIAKSMGYKKHYDSDECYWTKNNEI